MTDFDLAWHHTPSELAGRRRLAGIAGLQFDGDRDIYDVAGYEQHLSFEEYLDRYRRQDIAGRIIDMPAQATWRNPPEAVEVDSEGDEVEGGPFAEAFNALGRDVKVWHMLERVDRMAGIGEFAVLLLGLPGDDLDLKQPAPENLSEGDLMYLSPYHQGNVEIEEWETDPTNERFGLPTLYSVELSSGREGFDAADATVHWTRVIHVADDLLEDEVYGRPRLQRVFNRLYDLEKVTAATAESFWQLAARIFQVKVDPDFDIDSDAMEDIDDQMHELMDDLRRHVNWKGAEIDVLEGNEPDPSGAADLILTLISAAASIPKRILLGSERGELASTQDQSEWLARVSERQTRFAGPMILRPLVDRLIRVGVLPEPQADYEIQWPNLFELSELEKADTAAKYGRALKDMAPAGATDQVVATEEIREFLGLPPERPDQKLEDQFREEEDEAAEQELKAFRSEGAA